MSLVLVENDQQRLENRTDLGAGSVGSVQDGSVCIWDISSFVSPSGEPSSVFIGVTVEDSAMSAETIQMGSGQSEKTAGDSGALGRVTLKNLGHKHVRSC